LERLNAGASDTCHRVTLAESIHYHCAVLWKKEEKKEKEKKKKEEKVKKKMKKKNKLRKKKVRKERRHKINIIK
jgi:hypothetical protein